MHIPKTAGTSMRTFLESKYCSKVIDAQNILANKHKLKDTDFISGHLHLPVLCSLIDKNDWNIITTFRNPYSYVVSHLCWVRKAVDPGQESRLKSDPAPFVKIAHKMKEHNFADPNELDIFISWLESENMFFFHDTQTRYLLSPAYDRMLQPQELHEAETNFNTIDYVGDSSRLDEFQNAISSIFGWKLNTNASMSNSNSKRYGIDLDNPDTRNALDRLVQFDKYIYDMATLAHNRLVLDPSS